MPQGSVSKVTDKVVDSPLGGAALPVVFIDALYVKIRQVQMAERPIYVVLDINCDGERDVLGLRVGTGPVETGCHRPMTKRSLSSDHICCQVTVRFSSS